MIAIFRCMKEESKDLLDSVLGITQPSTVQKTFLIMEFVAVSLILSIVAQENQGIGKLTSLRQIASMDCDRFSVAE